MIKFYQKRFIKSISFDPITPRTRKSEEDPDRRSRRSKQPLFKTRSSQVLLKNQNGYENKTAYDS